MQNTSEKTGFIMKLGDVENTSKSGKTQVKKKNTAADCKTNPKSFFKKGDQKWDLNMYRQ